MKSQIVFFTSLVLLLTALPAGVFAESKTYCDGDNGTPPCNLKYCTTTCCTIITDADGNLTNANCSSSSCCAHPTRLSPGGQIEVPPNEVKGLGGFVRFGLLGVKGLNAANISVNVDDGSKTVTLSGNVKSERERREALATAKDHAKGYQVKSMLRIERPDTAPAASPPKP
jgi:hypothetical protein